jgi:hypothetical protein
MCLVCSQVVCSRAVYARATQQQPCLQHCSCLLAASPTADTAAAAGSKSDVEYVTLVTPHVCLDVFAQHSEDTVDGLAR